MDGAVESATAATAAASHARASAPPAPSGVAEGSPTPEAGRKNNSGIGERDAIAAMQEVLWKGGFTPDDVGYAVLGSVCIAINTDTLVQSTDMPPGMTIRQAARKSVTACISDFAAKGIRPRFGTISVNMPEDTTRSDAIDVAGGFADAAKAYNITIVAGDTNAGREFVFNVCMIGEQTAGHAVGRGGAAPGDLIFVTGPFGYTALGLKTLMKGGGHAPAEEGAAADKTVKRAIRAVLLPEVRPDFGERCAAHFTSSMDSSDGLASTLNEMARQSRCEFEIDTIPATRQLALHAEQNGMSLERLVFYGGEEYETVFTAPPSKRRKIKAAAASLRVPIIEIGTARNSSGSDETEVSGPVYMQKGDAGRVTIGDSGWEHFSAP